MARPLNAYGDNYNGVVVEDIEVTISGEDTENNRLMTYELWDYGDDNISASGVLKAAPGVLGVAQVIEADASGVVTFYDSDEESTTEKVVLGILPLATVGTQIKFNRPAAEGIYAVFSGLADAAVVAVGIL